MRTIPLLRTGSPAEMTGVRDVDGSIRCNVLVNTWSRSRRNSTELRGSPVPSGTCYELRKCWSESCASVL